MSEIKMTVLNKIDMELIRKWREEIPETLRTPYFLTQEMQEEYYKNVLSNRDSKTRYFAFLYKGMLGGMGGVENIEWENRRGEISIIVNPELRGKGMGKAIVGMILDYGFNRLNLDYIWGECFKCSPAVGFWEKIVDKKKADVKILPARKFHNGVYYESFYFTFGRENKI